MSNDFQIAETEHFQSKTNKPEFKSLYNKIYNFIYPQLRKNPYFGKNIRKLKGEFENVYRYRIGKLRLFYIIEEMKILVIMLDMEHRKDAYK